MLWQQFIMQIKSKDNTSHSNNPINPNKKTCYGNRPKFKEQKLPKLYQQNRIPIMSRKWTFKNLSKMDKKGLQCTYRFSFCHLLPRTLDSNPIQSSSKSHHHIIREGIPRWLYLTSWSTERSDESIVMYHHRWNLNHPNKKKRGTWTSAIHASSTNRKFIR